MSTDPKPTWDKQGVTLPLADVRPAPPRQVQLSPDQGHLLDILINVLVADIGGRLRRCANGLPLEEVAPVREDRFRGMVTGWHNGPN